MLLARVAVLALLAGCPGGDDDIAVLDGPVDARVDAPEPCAVGDVTQPIELAPVMFDLTDIVDLADGGTVPLLRPIQGGKVILVGVRARNVDPCARFYTLTGALSDPSSSQVIALEGRPVQLAAGGDGWAHPLTSFGDLANVPACPNASTQVDVDQASWRLLLRLEEDGGGPMAELTRTVAPRCLVAGEEAECACECDSDYSVGGACPVDP